MDINSILMKVLNEDGNMTVPSGKKMSTDEEEQERSGYDVDNRERIKAAQQNLLKNPPKAKETEDESLVRKGKEAITKAAQAAKEYAQENPTKVGAGVAAALAAGAGGLALARKLRAAGKKNK